MSLPSLTAGQAPTWAELVARREAARKESDIQPLLEGLKAALLRWRGE